MVCGQRQTFGITLYSPKQSNETAVLWLKIMTKQQSLNAFISVFLSILVTKQIKD
jgi:hypothetical protein